MRAIFTGLELIRSEILPILYAFLKSWHSIKLQENLLAVFYSYVMVRGYAPGWLPRRKETAGSGAVAAV